MSRSKRKSEEPPVYVEDLEEMLNAGCQCPSCRSKGPLKEVFFRQQCHPDAGMTISFKRGANQIEVGCACCGEIVQRVAVATKRKTLAFST